MRSAPWRKANQIFRRCYHRSHQESASVKMEGGTVVHLLSIVNIFVVGTVAVPWQVRYWHSPLWNNGRGWYLSIWNTTTINTGSFSQRGFLFDSSGLSRADTCHQYPRGASLCASIFIPQGTLDIWAPCLGMTLSANQTRCSVSTLAKT